MERGRWKRKAEEGGVSWGVPSPGLGWEGLATDSWSPARISLWLLVPSWACFPAGRHCRRLPPPPPPLPPLLPSEAETAACPPARLPPALGPGARGGRRDEGGREEGGLKGGREAGRKRGGRGVRGGGARIGRIGQGWGAARRMLMRRRPCIG